MQSVYSTFGFSFQLNLSTRPENFLGEVEIWDEAEKVGRDKVCPFISVSMETTRVSAGTLHEEVTVLCTRNV